jgi:hypothetical protein
MQITFDLLDTVTAYAPPPFLSHILGVWFSLRSCTTAQVTDSFSFPPTGLYIVVGCVSPVLWPLELMNPFFRVHYAFPAHAVWSVIVTVRSRASSFLLSLSCSPFISLSSVVPFFRIVAISPFLPFSPASLSSND